MSGTVQARHDSTHHTAPIPKTIKSLRVTTTDLAQLRNLIILLFSRFIEALDPIKTQGCS